jgi:hypothetical protein
LPANENPFNTNRSISELKKLIKSYKAKNSKDREYYLPGFIYDTNGELLDIYAFIDKQLDEKSKLYRAPLFNVTGQKVCLGSAKLNGGFVLRYPFFIHIFLLIIKNG